MRLTVSIVVYKSDPLWFAGTLSSLSKSIDYAKSRRDDLQCELYIVENDTVGQRNLKQAEMLLRSHHYESFDDIVVRTASKNLGYGSGHNLALSDSLSDYHLVLNPDVALGERSILTALDYLESTTNVAIVSPAAVDGDGAPLYLCKRYPNIFDLLLRGFAPNKVKSLFSRRLSKYERHDLKGLATASTEVDIVSGCCMLMPTRIFNAVSGFDEKFFLYFEDFDLSLRVGARGKLIYLPGMTITHYGGYAARKGLWHVLLFASSAYKFYQRYGWRWF